MAKLFFSLYLMVLASLVVFIFYILSIDYLGNVIGEGRIIEEKVSKGTFMLLNDSLDGLNKQQTETLLKQYKTLFGNGFMLIEQARLNLNKEDLRRLNAHQVVSVEENQIFNKKSREVLSDLDTVTILYFKRRNTSQVWRLELDIDTDISINESGLLLKLIGGRFSNGMMVLLQSRLLSHPSQDWPTILKNLQPDFGLPLSLISLETIPQEINNRSQIMDAISNNKTVNISQGTDVATFVKKIPHSQQLLQVGPIKIPWYIRNMPLLIILAFILSIATTLFLWIWPLWSNLMKLQQASDKFGAGSYATRIPINKISPIKKITIAFNKMAERTQRSIQAQKELTSAVSHELRTPVARMRFALDMLESSDDQQDQSRYIEAINQDIDELDTLLEELLNYARYDHDSPPINQCTVRIIPWFKKSMAHLEPLADQKQLRYKNLNVDDEDSCCFDPRLMSRVLDNLVQNAIRYAHHSIQVTINKETEYLTISVDDDGIGISQEKRKHIFDAFSRIDSSRDRESGGFGLGLAIVDRIIKAHKGTIHVDTSTLGGARFTIKIPLKQSTNTTKR